MTLIANPEERAALFIEIMDATVAREERLTGIPCSEFRVPAKSKTKARPNGEDVDWWKTEGLKQIDSYLLWMQSHDWEIALLPNGKHAIEWEAEVTFGGIPVRLVIDAVYAMPNGDLIVVDYKTGSKPPIGFEQLGLYASALEKAYGIRPKYGAFYSTRKGELEDVVSLDPWDIDYFNYMFRAMAAQQETGTYIPNVGFGCAGCGVKAQCVAWGSELSQSFPLYQPEEGKE